MTNLDEFIEIIGAEFPDDRLTHQKGIPTFHPESADEASRFLKLANSHRGQVYITGFGNNIDPIDEPFTRMITIRTDRLNRFLEISPIDFFIRVGAGYPLREINHRLIAERLYLPHASLPYTGSVGGAVAVALAGMLGGHDVPIKKYFIQAEIVTPQGDIITPGSACFKSVSGYDIVKIFAGSWGQLGLIVSATFRVMPETGSVDFAQMVQKGIDREAFKAGTAAGAKAVDALYSRKIKEKFDPNLVLPPVF